MLLEVLELKNFCQHAYKRIDFGPGLTAILGPNGSGKSNTFGGIRFSLTGENPNPGKLEDNIYDRAPVTETSFTRLRFSHGDVTATVQRNLRPRQPTAELTIHGRNGQPDEVVRGTAAVDARILQILGVSADILNEIVIVSQQNILGFLDKTPGKRAELFQRLFQTTAAGTLHSLLGGKISAVEIPSIGVDADTVRTNITQAEADIVRLSSELAAYGDYSQLQRQRDEKAELIRMHNDCVATANAMGKLSQQLDSKAAAIAVEQAGRDKAKADLATIEAAANANAPAVEQAKQVLANLAQWRAIATQRQTVMQQIQDTDVKLQQLSQPQAVPMLNEVGVKDLELHQFELRKEQNFLASFKAGATECPTCGSPAAQIEAKIPAAQARIPVLQEHIARLTAIQRDHEAFTAAMRAWQISHAKLETTRNELQQRLAGLPATPSDAEQSINEVALKGQISQQDLYAAGITELRDTISTFDRSIAAMEGSRRELETQWTNTSTRLATLRSYTEAEYTAAQQVVANWDQTISACTDLSTRLAVAQNTKQLGEQQLQQLESVAARATKMRGLVGYLTDMRDVLHKDAAPRFVSHQNLLRLQADVNERLEMFQARYRVEADEGLAFEAFFANGSRQSDDRLSQGQKVVLAVTFNMALNVQFAAHINALYLDEPTAALDADSISCFEPVLNRLRSYTASRGLQVIIVTHEQRLAPLFDHVVQL